MKYGQFKRQIAECKVQNAGAGQFRIQNPETRIQNWLQCHPERVRRVERVSQNRRDVSTSLDMTATSLDMTAASLDMTVGRRLS